MAKTFVMGDIHGAHKALIQVLEKSGFNKEEDTLIQLGDVTDRGPDTYECVEELLSIKNLISIKGNHDEWWEQYLNSDEHPAGFKQGAFATLRSYGINILGSDWSKFAVGYDSLTGEVATNFSVDQIPKHHIDFFKNQLPYYKDDKNRLFVHGGFNRHMLLKDQVVKGIFWWDRDLWHTALSFKAMDKGLVMANLTEKTKFKIKEECSEVFIGHTPTTLWSKDTPMNATNIWNVDTGAGAGGKLTIMDVDTKEYWQSDLISDLYN